MNGGPIGIFDSGVGGLSVWRQVVHCLPSESTFYVADQAHVPYGHRSADEIQSYCLAIADHLVRQGCKAIVVACNTASAVALEPLRDRFPSLPILGLEPAVKPAVQLTRSGVVGVMATPATFQGQLYRATVGRTASAVQVVEQVCTGLADLVEQGDLEGPHCDAVLQGFLAPMLAAGADTIVLGCTHYPFVIEAIRRLVGPSMAVLDPAPAVAKHLSDVLRQADLLAPPGAEAEHRFFTSADPASFDRAVARLVGAQCSSAALMWRSGPELCQR
ncbi:glutamate racemase [Vulcanococcus sp.]|jgi:glutamate racemase|uniref:glutamate racemase n=1 Tax=Vulcanococcus sp. TaxID=2856995 RepID=UPI003229E819